ncbi:hypothetical protein CPB86DRAFT_825578 [Serendipita vermifera]|nr:hypothetical protein CPB86DRAFT_825578 [Serendipita vermifera]
MIVYTSIHALVKCERENTDHLWNEDHLVQTRELVENARKPGGWVTRWSFNLLNNGENLEHAQPLEGVEEFTSSDFAEFLHGKLNEGHASESAHPHERHQEDFLKSLLPLPHVYSGPLERPGKKTKLSTWPVTRHVHPSMRVCFPYSLDNINSEKPNEDVQPDANANREWYRMKMAWIIPVQSQPTYVGASVGRLLLADTPGHSKVDILNTRAGTSQPKDLQSHEEAPEILWTPATLLEFWNWLLHQRLAERAGPLDIIFSVYPSGLGESKDASCTIKVICDGKRAMKVRALLAVFYVNRQMMAEGSTKHPGVDKSALSSENEGKVKEKTRWDDIFSPMKDAVLELRDEKGGTLLLA